MKTARLIELLSTLPADVEVTLLVPDGHGTYTESDINAFITYDGAFVHFVLERHARTLVAMRRVSETLDNSMPLEQYVDSKPKQG